MASSLPHQVTQYRVENIPVEQIVAQSFKGDQERSPPVLIEMQAGGRCPTADGCTDVDEIAVAVGARTEH